jgi:hypothetical protein
LSASTSPRASSERRLALGHGLHEPRVVERDRGLVGERLEHADVVGVEGGRPEAVVEIDGAEHPAAHVHRQAEHRAKPQVVDRELVAVALVFHGVDGQRELARLDDPARDAVADLEARVADVLLVEVARDPHVHDVGAGTRRPRARTRARRR